jgi:hypothetical protein
MAKVTKYELGFNWTEDGESLFLEEIRRAARKRRIQWISVTKTQAEKFRRRVDRHQVRVGLFLNTQADGVNRESPAMMVCRSLKAAGCLVVEDPDDAHIYADRGLLFDYLKRAGLPVPRHTVIENWKADKPPVTAAERARLGIPWIARPAKGMSWQPPRASSSKITASALKSAGFKPGQRVLIHKHIEPHVWNNRVGIIQVWHFFDHIVPCITVGKEGLKILTVSDMGSEFFGQVINLVKEIARITQLDWFLSELAIVKVRTRLEPVVLEPANALAGIGPGLKPLRTMPAEVMRIAAERIVKMAWRYAHRLPLSNGVTVRLLP